MKKRKVCLDIYNSVTLLVYVATYFCFDLERDWSRRRRTKYNKNLELIMDVDKLVLVMNI